MESKDSALLHFGSRFPSSAPRTGQARFRASGVPNPAGISGTFTSPQSSEQFVWLNRRYGETETQLSPSAIMPSTRADSSQNAVI